MAQNSSRPEIRFNDLPEICGGHLLTAYSSGAPVIELILDSRKTTALPGQVFFAVRGERHDGHRFIREVYQKGIRHFVVEYDSPEWLTYADGNFLLVKSAIDALQKIASHHRASFSIPVVGITGSNGKTIIKEWLYQLLSRHDVVVKNPGSYNSQIGVPLSVWKMSPHHTIGVFEAGVSKPEEMQKLQAVIKPTIGIFTNIGTAHDEGFSSREEKIREKLALFKGVQCLICCLDHDELFNYLSASGISLLSWGFAAGADVHVLRNGMDYQLTFRENSFSLHIPFSDSASIENCLHCVATLLYLGYTSDDICNGIKSLKAIPMRLELKEGINQCQIIDDSYNNDLAGLEISLQFLTHQRLKNRKTVILSDILESGLAPDQLAARVSELITRFGIDRFIGIGPVLSAHKNVFGSETRFFETTDAFLKEVTPDTFSQEVILIKGARIFGFEQITARLQRKIHGTVMEIDLGAIVHNLNFIKSRLNRSTKVMVMVKAFAYGSGSNEVANLLQFHRVDYLGVAYADEGVELRKNNITLPVMVMNPSEESFELLQRFDLEPEIYSFTLLRSLVRFLNGNTCSIHVKIDTGMHRLGFAKSDLPKLGEILRANPNIRVASVFSHLAGADEQQHDEFSESQARLFEECANMLSESLTYRPLFHLLNSPGILRLPHLQYDMVRLGIGLYGIDPTSVKSASLRPAATLKTVISQIRRIEEGETVGYGRRGHADGPRTIATIAIGYADGYSRAFSRGVGQVLVRGRRVPVIGNVCMDMTMIDVTGTDAEEGDEVIIFGKHLPIEEVAGSIGTIPYEILTSTSERVKRVFTAESL